jgi:hypothetical protein
MNEVFGLSHIDEQARRLCLPDYYAEHSLGRLGVNAIQPDVSQVHVHQVKSRTPRTLLITQEEPPLSILDVREEDIWLSFTTASERTCPCAGPVGGHNRAR